MRLLSIGLRQTLSCNVTRAGWKWMIYQLVLSRHLTKHEVTHLFEGDQETVQGILYELERCQLIRKRGNPRICTQSCCETWS